METIAARAGALERDVAWGVIRTLLGPALTRRTEGERADLLSGAARLAGPIVGHGGEEDAALIGSEGIGAALHGLYWLTANIAERSPLLAVVDDAHWADLASLRWVAYMARRIEELPILLLVACRQAEPGVDMGVIAALRTEPAARTVLPAPLTERGSAQMVRSGLSVDADAGLLRRLSRGDGRQPVPPPRAHRPARRRRRRADRGRGHPDRGDAPRDHLARRAAAAAPAAGGRQGARARHGRARAARDRRAGGRARGHRGRGGSRGGRCARRCRHPGARPTARVRASARPCRCVRRHTSSAARIDARARRAAARA